MRQTCQPLLSVIVKEKGNLEGKGRKGVKVAGDHCLGQSDCLNFLKYSYQEILPLVSVCLLGDPPGLLLE